MFFWFAIYIIIWWLCFYITLPFWVNKNVAQELDDDNLKNERKLGELGQDRGAPSNALILRKVLVATLLSAIITSLIYYLYSQGYFVIKGLFFDI